MSRILIYGLAIWALLALEPQDLAPDFCCRDTRGQLVDTSKLRGKLLVLEWFNPDCPPDMAYYEPPYQQKLQERFVAQGVEWILVCSAAHGIGGKLSPERANQWQHNRRARPSHIVLDPDQQLCKQFAVESTPTVFLIGPDGKVLYRGAIDDGENKEYLLEAILQAQASKPIAIPRTRNFGCGIR